jgi:hypothetical protein
LFYFFFCLKKIRWPKRLDGVLPYRYSPARHLSHIYPNDGVAFWLVVASSHAAGAIEMQDPIALSILIFFVPQFATGNDGQTSSPTRSARLHRLSKAPPHADTIVRLVGTFPF